MHNYDEMTQEELREFIFNDEDWWECYQATKRLTDQPSLEEVALNHNHRGVRAIATSRLIKQETLKRIALNKNESSDVRVEAVMCLIDPETLKEIALKEKDGSVSFKAIIRLSELGQPLQ